MNLLPQHQYPCASIPATATWTDEGILQGPWQFCKWESPVTMAPQPHPRRRSQDLQAGLVLGSRKLEKLKASRGFYLQVAHIRPVPPLRKTPLSAYLMLMEGTYELIYNGTELCQGPEKGSINLVFTWASTGPHRRFLQFSVLKGSHCSLLSKYLCVLLKCIYGQLPCTACRPRGSKNPSYSAP